MNTMNLDNEVKFYCHHSSFTCPTCGCTLPGDEHTWPGKVEYTGRIGKAQVAMSADSIEDTPDRLKYWCYNSTIMLQLLDYLLCYFIHDHLLRVCGAEGRTVTTGMGGWTMCDQAVEQGGSLIQANSKHFIMKTCLLMLM